MSDCPSAPQSKDPEELGFEPQPMVGWIRPSTLLKTGVKVVLSTVFGAYADSREIQAALNKQAVFDYSDKDDIWIDYIADVGDGWDSTYTMARLLAEPALSLSPTDGDKSITTQRGRILVMGGDEVYPTSNRDEYNNRTVGPYRAALPYVDESQPHLFAIPGNHDWYDGLTSFSRLFLQNRWIGGWQTRQSRSYFAIKLPHDWWLWGLDVQLESDIDDEQFKYFAAIAGDPNIMKPGSKLILCSAEPSWVYASTKGREAYNNLRHVEKRLIDQYGHRMVIGLAGDLHCYAHYPQVDGDKHRFIVGGGGAYLYPTHHLPEKLDVPCPSQPEHYAVDKVFPDKTTSKRLAVYALLFPFLNRGNLGFSIFLGLFYLFFAWVIQSVSKIKDGAGQRMVSGELTHDGEPMQVEGKLAFKDSTFLEVISQSGFGTVFSEAFKIMAHAPNTVYVMLVLVLGLIAFADAKKLPQKIAMGLAHAGAHIVLLMFLLWCIADLNLNVMGWGVDEPVQVLSFALVMTMLGGVIGGMVMGFYLYISNLWGSHANEVFSCQSIPDYKNFMRLHLNRDGSLELYPIGVKKVCKSWRLMPEAQHGAAWFEPDKGAINDYAKLIDKPIETR